MLILGSPCSLAGRADTYLGTGMPFRLTQITPARLFDQPSSLSLTFVLLPSADTRYLNTCVPLLVHSLLLLSTDLFLSSYHFCFFALFIYELLGLFRFPTRIGIMNAIAYLLAWAAFLPALVLALDPAPNSALPAGWKYKGCYR